MPGKQKGFNPRTSARKPRTGAGVEMGDRSSLEELPPEARCDSRRDPRGRKIVPVITHPPRDTKWAETPESQTRQSPPAGPSLQSFASSGPLC